MLGKSLWTLGSWVGLESILLIMIGVIRPCLFIVVLIDCFKTKTSWKNSKREGSSILGWFKIGFDVCDSLISYLCDVGLLIALVYSCTYMNEEIGTESNA